MKSRLWTSAVVALGLSLLSGHSRAFGDNESNPTADLSKKAHAMISKTLEGAPRSDAAGQRQLLQQAAAEALPLLTGNVLVSGDLNRALAEARGLADDSRAAGLLRTALRDARDTLAFKPSMEAKLPEGFPEPTPVGEIRIKTYPAYRLARAAVAGKDTRVFWTLFQHIQKSDIAMTAPVEMTYGSKEEQGRPQAMAFLYQHMRLGAVGKDGNVEVADVPAMTAVSIGLRGETTQARVADALTGLEAWLKQHADQYAAAGPLRVMGYNSPFVPASRRYFEVEIPVRRLTRSGDQPPKR
jgi:hypothetical protein